MWPSGRLRGIPGGPPVVITVIEEPVEDPDWNLRLARIEIRELWRRVRALEWDLDTVSHLADARLRQLEHLAARLRRRAR